MVDDTAVNLQLLEELLQENGYKVAAFPGGELALRSALRNPPDLILLDIMMPGMDGFEVCRMLKANDALRHIPVIFISALNATGDKVRAFSRGGVDFVTKPFQEAEVLARVRAQIELLSMRRQLAEHNQKLEELVAEKTRDLVRANLQLSQSSRIKDDFLHMISHEIRTPANGVLSIGELLVADSGQDELREIFNASSQRLRDLIDNATLIGEIEELARKNHAVISLADVLGDLARACPHLAIRTEPGMEPGTLKLKSDRTLLAKGLTTMVNLAASFSSSLPPLQISLSRDSTKLIAAFEFRELPITAAQAAEFFCFESKVRSASAAEPLGLAPVVAEKILEASGGSLAFSVVEGQAAALVAELPVAGS